MAKNIDKICNEENKRVKDAEERNEQMLGYINNIIMSLDYLKKENRMGNRELIEFWENQAKKYRRD